ncbi:MAG TPA: hypothetical protein VL527_17700, partial [Dongiaceae bacterium]|nr:hypothetical protein [Dongiaceae bacterium]
PKFFSQNIIHMMLVFRFLRLFVAAFPFGFVWLRAGVVGMGGPIVVLVRPPLILPFGLLGEVFRLPL